MQGIVSDSLFFFVLVFSFLINFFYFILKVYIFVSVFISSLYSNFSWFSCISTAHPLSKNWLTDTDTVSVFILVVLSFIPCIFVCVGEPALARENNCLNAAKACNLNDTCKKYRSAYISPCTSRVSTAEVCNKRKCHKALRQFFDKVPPKHSYGMLFCSCPLGDQMACSERRRQTIVPACSYEDKEKPNCLALQASCKTNYICRSEPQTTHL